MAFYMASAATVRRLMKMTPEQAKAGFAAWDKWAKAHKKDIVDLGNPLGRTKRIVPGGAVSDTRNQLTGYSIVRGASADAVMKMFRDHPHLSMSGTSVDVLEVIPMASLMPKA